jgi:excisionase family DNA binding protein
MSMSLEMKDQEVLLVHEAAQELGITPGRVRQLVVEGRIEPIRVSPRMLLIPRSEVAAYQKSRRPYRKP